MVIGAVDGKSRLSRAADDKCHQYLFIMRSYYGPKILYINIANYALHIQIDPIMISAFITVSLLVLNKNRKQIKAFYKNGLPLHGYHFTFYGYRWNITIIDKEN